MKRAVRISLSAAVLAAMALLLAVLSKQSGRARHEITCTGLEVKILDSARLGFVSEKDVRDILYSEYGVILGKRIDSISLYKIENILDGRSAINKSQAYTTADGILHVSLTQREPIVMLDRNGTSFYADETGFIFPPVEGYQTKVPVIYGAIPLEIEKGYKGQVKTEKERQWLGGIIEMVEYLEKNRNWNSSIKEIKVEENGDLVFYPIKGKEKFILGRPENFENKFRRLEDYYRYIVPSKEEGYYTIVNVKYDGQIICRRK